MKVFEINTKTDIVEFFTYLTKELRVSIHPDDSFTNIVSLETGEPTFTAEEAAALDKTMQECHTWCDQNNEDIYEIGLNVLQAKGLYAPEALYDFMDLPEEVKPAAVTSYIIDELMAGDYHGLDTVFKHALKKAEPDMPSKTLPGLYALQDLREHVHFLMSAYVLKIYRGIIGGIIAVLVW